MFVITSYPVIFKKKKWGFEQQIALDFFLKKNFIFSHYRHSDLFAVSCIRARKYVLLKKEQLHVNNNRIYIKTQLVCLKSNARELKILKENEGNVYIRFSDIQLLVLIWFPTYGDQLTNTMNAEDIT